MRINKKIGDKKLLVSIVTSLFFVLLVSAISGFRYTYGTNDDYMMSLLICNGEKSSIFLNYFLTSVLVEIQRIFSGINCFALFEQIGCIFALITINYIIYKKFDSVVGVLFSLLVSAIVCVTNIIMIQWTHTTVVFCIAGVLALIYGFLYESNKKLKIIQIAVGILWVLLASLVRIDAVKVCFVFAGVLIACLFVELLIDTKHDKKVVRSSIKRLLITTLCMILVFVCGFSVDIISECIKEKNENYTSYTYFNSGRSKVTDYELAPYDGNVEFYNELGISSQQEIDMIASGYIDKDVFDAKKLNAIGDYAKEMEYGGDSKIKFFVTRFAKKLIRFAKDIYSGVLELKNVLGLSISNIVFVGAFLLLCGVLLFAVIIALMVYSKKHSKKFSIKDYIIPSGLTLIWIVFFCMYRISINTVLMLPICVFVVLSAFFGNYVQRIICCINSFAVLGLYCYQDCFRLSFRVAYTFILPTIVFVLFMFNSKYITHRLGFIKGKMRTFLKGFIIGMFAVSLLIPIMMVWVGLYVPSANNKVNTINDYTQKHQETSFVHVISQNANIDEAYYRCLLVPSVKENSILFGSWCIASDYYTRMLDDNNVNVLFEDMIDNEYMSFAIENKEDMDIVSLITNHYNKYYTEDDTEISLELDETISCVGETWGRTETESVVEIYKVVTR